MIRVRAVRDEAGLTTGYWHCLGLERDGHEALVLRAATGDQAYLEAARLLSTGEANWA